jgi:hypothetical protein
VRPLTSSAFPMPPHVLDGGPWIAPLGIAVVTNRIATLAALHRLSTERSERRALRFREPAMYVHSTCNRRPMARLG